MTRDWRENARRHWRELSADDISQHLYLARHRPGTPAGCASTWILLDHYRRGVEREMSPYRERCAATEREMKGGKITEAAEFKRRFDPMIADFFGAMLRRVLLASDPVAKLKHLLGSETPRGRPARNADRDFGLAVKVAGQHRGGLTVAEAVEAVCQSMLGQALSSERMTAIYQRHRLEALATAAEAAMKKSH